MTRILLLLALALPALADKPPNLIVVITDDQGYAPLGAHGHPWIRTPHLDALHEKSVRFGRFLVSPTCSPTRAALLTGRHPLKNGVTHTIWERERLALGSTTLAEVLAESGYATGIFGKWHLGDEDAYQPGERGFDEVFIHGAGGIGQSFKSSCADVPDNSYFDPVVRHNGRFVKTRGFCTDVFFDAALGWIDERKDDDAPFFCWLATNAPHGPFLAPEEDKRRFKEAGFPEKHAGFYGMIENIDANLGRLVAKLEAWRLMEDTVLIFMSDNGMAGSGGGEADEELAPGFVAWNAGMKGLKGTVDEGGVRVPFLVRADGRFEGGRTIEEPAAHIDLMPTFAALAEADLPAGQVEGLDLGPLLRGESERLPDRFLFTHRGRWKVGSDPDKAQWNDFAVRDRRFRYVNGTALFDMIEDPGQTTNVIDQHPDRVAAMRAAYQRFWREARPLMVNEDAEMSPTRPYHQAYRAQKEADGIPDWDEPEF